MAIEFANLPEFPFDEVSNERYLSSGTFGIVHKCTWRDRDVAIKTIRLHWDTAEPARRARAEEEFKREASILYGLNHRNIVKVLGMFKRPADGGLAIIMEYADKGPLKVPKLEQIWSDASASGQASIFSKRKKFILELIDGLDYLHKQRIIHRDLKPDNILCFGSDPTPKICDFGLAKIVPNSEVYAKSQVGSLLYMAPELFPKDVRDLESIKYKKTADIYSLTLIIYQLHGGGDRFYPDYKNTMYFLMAKSQGLQPQLRFDGLPLRLVSVIRRGVATDPKQRPRLDELAGAILLSNPEDDSTMEFEEWPEEGADGTAV